MFSSHRDIPLEKDISSRFLPWVIAVMVYLSVLALAVGLVTHQAFGRWQAELRGSMTVEIPPPGPDNEKQTIEARMKLALDVLNTTRGVMKAVTVPEQRVEELLEPWLGSDELLTALPLPQLIDVRVDPENKPDMKTTLQRLQEAVPGARIDDHRSWAQKLVNIGRWAQVIAGLSVLFTGLSAIAIVVFAVRSGLTSHKGTIEVLHLIGARDGYIAKQFQDHALRLSFLGAFVGAGAAAASIFALSFVAEGLTGALLPMMRLELEHWGYLGLIPLMAIILSIITARMTVMRALRQMV